MALTYPKTAIDFGSTYLERYIVKPIIVQNETASDITLTIDVPVGFFWWLNDTDQESGSLVIPANDFEKFWIAFYPTRIESYSDTMTFTDDVGDTSITLTGEGIKKKIERIYNHKVDGIYKNLKQFENVNINLAILDSFGMPLLDEKDRVIWQEETT